MSANKAPATDYVRAINNAARVIKALSPSVEVCGVVVRGTRPVIKVKNCSFCQSLIKQGKASYAYFGRSEIGPYRQGQYLTGGCKVVWSEVLLN